MMVATHKKSASESIDDETLHMYTFVTNYLRRLHARRLENTLFGATPSTYCMAVRFVARIPPFPYFPFFPVPANLDILSACLGDVLAGSLDNRSIDKVTF